MEQKFGEFSQFKKSGKFLNRGLGSIQRSYLLPVSYCLYGNTLVSYARNYGFK